MGAHTNHSSEFQAQIKQARGKFACMVATYAMGAMNDNMFKQAIMLLAIFTMSHHDASNMQSTSAILFVAPWLLFAAPAGWLADRFSKRNIVIASKTMELLAMIAGATGIILVSWPLMMVMLFLMALQSTLFSPAMNGSIPELYPESYVLQANSRVKIIVTCMMLVGIVMGGVLLGNGDTESGESFDEGRWAVASAVVGLALLGLIVSLGVVKRPAAQPDAKFPWSGPVDTVRKLIAIFRSDRLLSVVIVGDMITWFVAIVLTLEINLLGKQMFNLSPANTSYLLVAQLGGVGIGGGVAGMLGKNDRWKRAIAPAMLAMGVLLIATGATCWLPSHLQLWTFVACMVPVGIAGGILLVPLESFFQVRAKPEEKGAVIAATNFAGFLAMGLAAATSTLLNLLPIGSLHLSILGAFCLPMAGWLAWEFRKNGGLK
jgi:acyl-[acyl-carrier-protein]-phospholipid O-acyltransferase/long-chain-fatty-acid--[acyl-carrier-protein] ligase